MPEPDSLTLSGFSFIIHYMSFNDNLAFELFNNRQLPEFKTIEVRQVAHAGGAEVLGVDLKNPSAEQIAEIKIAKAEYSALAFREQFINTEQHKTFAENFGTIHKHLNANKRRPGIDESVLAWTANKHSRFTVGEGFWHNDAPCDEFPITTSILRLIRQPKFGGETAFINTHLAYESLSTSMKSFLTGLTAEQSGTQAWTTFYGDTPAEGQSFPTFIHPIVIKNPDTGRSSLFVNRGFTTHIPQLTRKESNTLLEFLFNHIETSYNFQYRIKWQPGTVLMWDNLYSQHMAIWDY